jgi:hypothetical protein
MYVKCSCRQLCYTYDMVFIAIFKIKHKLYTASGPAPRNEKFWVRTCGPNEKVWGADRIALFVVMDHQ